MKSALLFSIILSGLFTFSNPLNLNNKYPDYEKEWEEAEALLGNGLLEQASEKIQAIYDMAVRDANHPQIFKSLLRLESIRVQKDEEGLKGVIMRLEKSIKVVREPARSLLFSVLGECYRQLSERSGWAGDNRTDLAAQEQDSVDIGSWSMKSLLAKASEYYKRSMEFSGIRKESLQDYGAIVNFGVDSLAKPTLYELLSYRFIEFYKSSRASLMDFDHETPWNIWFGSVEGFIQSDFPSGSAGLIYSQLLDFHRKSGNDHAFVFANLSRLEYAYNLIRDQEASHSLYENALKSFYAQVRGKKVSCHVLLKLLELYYSRAESGAYDPESKWAGPWTYVGVDSLANQILSQDPDPDCKNAVDYYKMAIRQKMAEVRIEKVNISGEPILISVLHRNLHSLNFSLYKLRIKDSGQYEFYQSGQYDSAWMESKPFRQWTDSWPGSSDFRRHSVELKMDPLQPGAYLLVTETPDGQKCQNPIFFQVSQLASVLMKDGSRQDKLLVLDRKTGKPMKGAKVLMYGKESPDYWDRSVPVVKWAARTNSQGLVALKFNNRLITRISDGKDELWGEEYAYPYYQGESVDSKIIHFFTDRAIYRPGQTVHFKLLFLKHDGKTGYPEPVRKSKVEVQLKDANYREVGKLELKTNDLGAASGSFILPSGVLKGMFSLQGGFGSLPFRVEEYRRPSFELRFDSTRGDLKLNALIPVSGSVMTFNDVPVGNAKVNYKVYRSIGWFDFDLFGYRKIFPFGQRTQIDQGSVLTDENGKFSVSFQSAPDPGFAGQVQQFTLALEAVADNGETQENAITFRLSDQSLFLSSNMKDPLVLDSSKHILFSASNVNGQALVADYSIKIFKVKHKSRHLKDKYWEKPDVFKFGREEYQKLFPNDVYKDEDDPMKFPVEALIFEKNYSGKSQIDLDLSAVLSSAAAVKFVVEAAGPGGGKAKFEKVISVFREGGVQTSMKPQLHAIDGVLMPGKNANVFIDFPDPYSHVFTVWNTRGSVIQEWVKTERKGVRKYSVKTGEEGQVHFHAVCVRDNRFYHFNYSYDVPWESKKIKIRTESFRSSILPGSDEKWTFRLELPGGLAKTELLASMYDASLDMIQPHSWKRDFWPGFYDFFRFESKGFGHYSCYFSSDEIQYHPFLNQGATTELIVPDLGGYYPVPMAASENAMGGEANPSRTAKNLKNAQTSESDATQEKQVESASELSVIPVRKNLKETVFFYPDLKPDSSGLVSLSFKMNEALTRWKLQLFAHSQDMCFGFETMELQTKKPLQIKPFYPRYFRQGDSIEIRAVVSNVEAFRQEGLVGFSLMSPDGGTDQTSLYLNSGRERNFSLESGASATFSWKLFVPLHSIDPVLLRFQVRSGVHSDGEESIVPVLSNRKLVTESWPMHISGNSEKSFHFKGVQNAFSKGAQAYSYSIEFSSNPVWYAIQSLPYMTGFSNECSEHIMSKVFAHAIGSYIMENMPRIREVLERIDLQGVNVSPLLKNQELKSALLEETPWVLEALNETEQMKSISQLMDFNNMRNEIAGSVEKLSQLQYPDGSFSWFSGGKPDRVMTQHIITQISHLSKLGTKGPWSEDLERIRIKAKPFLDKTVLEDYTLLAKRVSEGKARWEDQHIGPLHLHYLYAVSYDPNWLKEARDRKEVIYYIEQLKKHWLKFGLYEQGLAALVCHRLGLRPEAGLIVESLRQRAIRHPELGMYWKTTPSYYWYQMPVETQALLIEAFYEIKGDVKVCDEMKVWLLKNKQTNHWGSGKSTALAVFALLTYGSDWSASSQTLDVSLGDYGQIKSFQGLDFIYSKKRFDSKEIKPGFQEITMRNPNASVAWGAAYVQYWQDLDLVRKSNQSGLFLDQGLYKREVTKTGTQLVPVESFNLAKGDRLVSRCIIKSDRPMEYLHLKIMRAAGLELIEQTSGYEWSGGMGYYKSPGDLATDIYIPYLPVGTFVLEYDLRCAFGGHFSQGVPSIQCMYAPEFSALGSGQRIVIH